MPTAPAPREARSTLRPVATSRRSPLTSGPWARLTVKASPSWLTCLAGEPVRTSMPSRPKTSAISAPASGSSCGSNWPAASTMVTRDPNRAKTCASSAPIAPPPSMTIDSGSSPVSITSWLVQYGVPASPGMGGMAGEVPVAMTIPRRARSTSPLTVTSPGAVIRPYPRNSRPPLPVNRSAATVSSQLSVASARIRCATGAQSGVTVELPAMPGMRRPSVSRPAARIIILDGMHPQYGHSPPTSLACTPATARPASASRPATSPPLGPRPMTTTSTSCSFTCAPSLCPLPGFRSCLRVSQRGMTAPASRLTLTEAGVFDRHGRGNHMIDVREGAERAPASPLTEDAAEEHVHGICFKTGPPGVVGVELEWLVCDRDDVASPVDHQLVATALAGLQAPGALPGQGRLTIEPGGQVEISSAPAAAIGGCVTSAGGDLAAVRQAVAAAGLSLVGWGMDPYRPPARILDLPPIGRAHV